MWQRISWKWDGDWGQVSEMVRRQGSGFVWFVIKHYVQRRHYEWIKAFNSRKLLAIDYSSSNFQGFEGEVWHQRWNGPAIRAGECTQTCPSTAHRMLCHWLEMNQELCCLFQSFYLKSSSAERAEKVFIFSCSYNIWSFKGCRFVILYYALERKESINFYGNYCFGKWTPSLYW